MERGAYSKKGYKEESGICRGITLPSVVGKAFCQILNNRLVECLEREKHCMKTRLALKAAWIMFILKKKICELKERNIGIAEKAFQEKALTFYLTPLLHCSSICGGFMLTRNITT